MAAATLTGKRAQEARDHYASGLGCNAIARAMGIDPATVSRWAKAEGLKFDRSQTALAVRAHTIDLAESRLELARKMQVAAHDLLDSLDGDYLVYNFGGKDNTYVEHVLEKPPVEVVRSSIVTAGIAFDKATKVLEKTNDGIGRAESLVDHLEQFFDTIPDEPADGE
jgi:hypothetical protein